MLERWREPIIPSATTAESRDSMAARSATTVAGRTKAAAVLKSTVGRWGIGRPRGRAPKREPMVSTGRPKIAAAAVAKTRAAKGEGIFLVRRGRKMRTARVAAESARVAPSIVGSAEK